MRENKYQETFPTEDAEGFFDVEKGRNTKICNELL